MQMEKEHLEILLTLLESLIQVVKNQKKLMLQKITVEALTELNENGGEANVSTGYHAIEFLLWGQDQDYNNFFRR